MGLKSESTSFFNGGQAGLAIIFITFQEPDQCELNTNTVTLRLSSSNDLKQKVFRVIIFECIDIFEAVNLFRNKYIELEHKLFDSSSYWTSLD
jgi:hypothetical protein